jgi:hypothetical protein
MCRPTDVSALAVPGDHRPSVEGRHTWARACRQRRDAGAAGRIMSGTCGITADRTIEHRLREVVCRRPAGGLPARDAGRADRRRTEQLPPQSSPHSAGLPRSGTARPHYPRSRVEAFRVAAAPPRLTHATGWWRRTPGDCPSGIRRSSPKWGPVVEPPLSGQVGAHGGRTPEGARRNLGAAPCASTDSALNLSAIFKRFDSPP